MTEDETLDACARFSIARFGDGELRLAVGGACSSQKADPKLARELAGILLKYRGLLVGIPNFARTPRQDAWAKYNTAQFRPLFQQELYASAFITRPDSAPWIDRPEYWRKVRELWANREVLLVVGDDKSITPEQLKNAGTDVPSAASCYTIEGPRQHAYSVVDDLERWIVVKHGEPDRPDRLVIMCLGAAATVLAARLHARGIHALDLGHMGMFLRHAGAYVDPATLISKNYRRQNVQLHARPEGFGGDGKKHAERVLEFARKLGVRSVLDYGCGEGTFKKAITALGWDGAVFEYDPAMKGKEYLPKPAGLLVCTDVLEHIEPDYLDAVLRHMHAVTREAAFLSIATRPANKVLPDGRNAHLIQETPQWWVEKLTSGGGWEIVDRYEKTKDGKAREVWLWLKKKIPGSTTATT